MKVLNKIHRGKQHFKFLSLRDRLRQTDLSSVLRRRKQVLAAGDNDVLARHGASLDTYLRTTIIQWSDRDRTRSFRDFASAVHPWVISLPLLLRNRKRVFRQWVRAVREQASSLAALTACWEAFAWDLATDFYPFLVPSIQVLAGSVDFGDATEIEVFFSTVMRLFRFWSKQQAVAGETYRILQTWRALLLSHRSEHVRLFAAQSAGVLLRRLANGELLLCVQAMVTANPDVAGELDSIRREADAVAATFFYGCTSVRGQLHSGALVLLDHLHRCVFSQDPETDRLDAYQQTLLIALWWRLGGELRPEATTRLLEMTFVAVDSASTAQAHAYCIVWIGRMVRTFLSISSVWCRGRSLACQQNDDQAFITGIGAWLWRKPCMVPSNLRTSSGYRRNDNDHAPVSGTPHESCLRYSGHCNRDRVAGYAL
ncbi:hypothetical protein F1559_004127 [Cyanidiococcus yangmingshanensis]|uniref:U3 snoRNP protein n=1 Tax=Cyanidiococcus yangmingshanensis TaxID=2690220 RepID=A0A7J7IIA1_9RHOD|nr:hypothetical protein F1559_004127 [Cyanidiococcus yangmingshanensis]